MGRIIVIDGTSNAGKTTLCENIERNIRNIAIIPGASLFAKIHHEKYPEIPGIPRNAKEEKENQKFFFKLELDRLIEANKLANCIQNQICDSLHTVDRGVKERPNLCVLKNTDMPAVLVELAFIDNDSDAELLANKQDDFARAVARGITDYFADR